MTANLIISRALSITEEELRAAREGEWAEEDD